MSSTYFSECRELMPSSLSIKRAVLEYAEFELDRHSVFNYGRTTGHALKAHAVYAIPHGQAIPIGMGPANEMADIILTEFQS